MQEIIKIAYWGGHVVRHAPLLAWRSARVALFSRLRRRSANPRIVIGTHHKALTVYLRRVFRTFALITGRSFSSGNGDTVDYDCDVLHDHHSNFEFSRLEGPWVGLHVSREPRDILLSASEYHLHSRESWLHRPLEKLGGLTYQEHVRSLPSVEDRLLFELEHEPGKDIQIMLGWDYKRPGMQELTYEQLVGPNAMRCLRSALGKWNLPDEEYVVLLEIFRYFALGSPGSRRNKHIRNPTPGQGRVSFTPLVERRFREKFPDAAVLSRTPLEGK